jgi:hypothetical protein
LLISLLFSSTFAQGKKGNATAKRRPASLKPAEVGVSQQALLQGSYTLIDLQAAKSAVEKAIEASVRKMWPIAKGKARRKLKKTNLPPPQKITIKYTSKEVSITTDVSGLITTPADGTTSPWKDYVVSTKWEGVYLKRTFKGDGGERVNTYEISADGKTLRMYVFAKSTGRVSLTEPLSYHLAYQRN